MAKSRLQKLTILLLLAASTMISTWMISCGGKIGRPIGGTGNTTTGTITTSLSDPPTCALEFDHFWITITKVQANTSSTAGPTDPGWVTLADFTGAPKQIDLLSLASSSCALNLLSSATGLPIGNYLQFRIYLLDNTATAGPSLNNCGSKNGFNCVVPHAGAPTELQMGTASTAGMIISPGQIAGGGINLTASQTADLNITFDSCGSVLNLPNGQFRLDPRLHLGAVGASNNSISGKAVDSKNNNPIDGAIVLLEQPDSGGIDRVMNAGVTASDGTFIFCPLASGNYDVVVDALTLNPDLTTTVYGATVAFNVPAGTALNNIPLVPQGTAAALLAAGISGQVTSAGAGGAEVADITLSVLQQATPTGGAAVRVTVPIFNVPAQPPTGTTLASLPAGPACTIGTDCFNYLLVVPSEGAQVGTFTHGSINYVPATPGGATYSMSATSDDCTASTPINGIVNSITVLPGSTTQVPTLLAFSGCTAPI